MDIWVFGNVKLTLNVLIHLIDFFNQISHISQNFEKLTQVYQLCVIQRLPLLTKIQNADTKEREQNLILTKSEPFNKANEKGTKTKGRCTLRRN